MPMLAKMRWSRMSLNVTVANPTTKTIVVISIEVPTASNVARIACLRLVDLGSSSWNLVRKWIVSSTAIPRQIVKQQTVTISSGWPVKTLG